MSATVLALMIVVAACGALICRIARARRCRCQREDPLAGLGALGTVTSRVRRSSPTRHHQGASP